MRTLIEIQRDAEKQLGIYTLTADYEIVYVLMDSIGVSLDRVRKLTRLSSTAFYNRLKGLHDDGVLTSITNPDDRRSRLYRLSEDIRQVILKQHRGYMNLILSRDSGTKPAGQELDIYRPYIQKGAVTHLTADFQILLYLYLKSGISNLDISQVVDVSMTKFHTSLTKLVSMGLIEFDKAPSDGRSKLYRLSALSLGVLDRLHSQVFEWLGRRAPIEN